MRHSVVKSFISGAHQNDFMRAFIVLLVVAVFSGASLASDIVSIYTDKGVYQAGDTGRLFIEISSAERNIEVVAEIISPEGIIIDGAILYTDLPERVVINPDTWQTEQVLIKEDVKYFTEGKIIREIPFAVPQAAPTGDYTVNVYIGNELKKSATIGIIGHGTANAILLIYLLAIVFIIGMKYYKHTGATSRRR